MARTMLDLASQVQGNLPNSQIALDSTHRFVTDTEKSTWNAKAETTVVTTEANGLMSNTMLTKLNGIEANANDYTHPASHALSMITETATKKIMTDAERTKLSGIETSADVTDAINVEASGALMDGDFASSGIMKRTGAGTYGIVTDNSANWNTAYSHTSETDNPHSVTLAQAVTAGDTLSLATAIKFRDALISINSAADGHLDLNADVSVDCNAILDMATHKITNVVDPTNDQDAATKKWVNDNYSGGSHTHALNNITDVTIDTVADNEVLQYNSTGGKWENVTLSEAGIEPTVNLTINRAVISNASGGLAVSAVTSTELGYLDGVTSSIQTQLNGKSSTSHTHALDDLSDASITGETGGHYLRYSGSNWVNSALQAGDMPTAIDAAKLANGTISNTEFQYLNGVTSGIQSQLNAKLALAGGTVSGNLTVSGNFTVNGTTTSIDTVSLEVEDNIIKVNKNQTGTPATTLVSGLEVERGDVANAEIVFVELDDKWKISTDGGTTRTAIALENDARFLTSAQKTEATRNATASQNGLMTSTYASKLDGIAANANNYSLPTATSSVLGGIKIGSNLQISSGVVTAKSASATQPGVDKAIQTETFTGDGSTTGFDLTYNPDWEGVYLSGMRQKVTDDYTVAGSAINFVAAPKTGQKIVVDYIPV